MGFRGSRVQIPPSRLSEDQALQRLLLYGFFFVAPRAVSPHPWPPLRSGEGGRILGVPPAQAACSRKYSRLPGGSRIRRSSTSIAADCTFRPASQRESVLPPSRRSWASSTWVNPWCSRIARISCAERRPYFARYR